MFIERPPFFYRMWFPGALWRIRQKGKKVVYLTFDDGPIPEVTPWVLSVLEERGIKATFFCVGDNVRKYPEVFQQLLDAGHAVGNHTFNHIQGIKCRTKTYVDNTEKADNLIHSSYFRPPHGHLRIRQLLKLRKKYKVIMWDLVTRDYSKRISPEQTLKNVKQYVRDGSIIVFHDSIKAEKNLRYALPKALDYLIREGYTFSLLP
ncbi:polysaccharide deacetylase family protein [Porphyromonas sp.]|uniref:polysaccharide deacetylase family protein n=1 Tax=Porphyromonas sp. TaxID=1924944 RepID=UPI0026DCE2FC|nr:polysaccharide deacetylase family protein [Porphyromonas sp.]MDO4695873.1 polysaccharide deacetylase family protein [Porphyromonas sp.]MDO4771399.1 polysaccharide deacetylase family protein [Porphyromonas sp.]